MKKKVVISFTNEELWYVLDVINAAYCRHVSFYNGHDFNTIERLLGRVYKRIENSLTEVPPHIEAAEKHGEVV